MSDFRDGLFCGVFFTAIVFICLNVLPSSYRSMAANAIAACEKTLPRDQECVITAIPKEQTP